MKGHSHPDDHIKIEAMKIRNKIYKDAKVHRSSNPYQLVSDSLKDVPLQIRIAVGKPESLRRRICAIRRADLPPEPQTMEDIHLTRHYRILEITTAPKNFLIYDNMHFQEEYTPGTRLLVFATKESLSVMSSCDQWFVDGTFGTAPKHFKQLFTIRVKLSNCSITCVYALLPNKKQETYEEFFTSVFTICHSYDLRPNVTTVSCDYEKAIHKAVISTFGNYIHIQGCFYHLTQSTWRKVQGEGLASDYKDNEENKLFCGMIDGTAFLPVEKVKEGIAYLYTIVPKGFFNIIDYFDRCYVSGKYQSTAGPRFLSFRRNNRPLYPIELWNVHETTLEGGSRTNNISESFNASILRLVGHKNPSLWKILECIQKDHINNLTNIERIKQGIPIVPRISRKTSQTQKRLETLCKNLKNGILTVPRFLRSVGHVIRFHIPRNVNEDDDVLDI